ncbi:unnamed protein product [Cuscuta campestris]|uniref:Uncharacterized protein n=1 Tax=Cuscuta campestris TaxID=132261 RepID=A0A484NHZ2_9ASTE|nr:unnamed protein product [Cuscuta campestris]
MEPDTPLDCVLLQLSPKRTRCDLFVSTNGKTEKLASGVFKSFVTYLKVAEKQVASAMQSIKLDVGGLKDAHLWFRKGTLERFVRFVSTPEVLEVVNNFDAEMSQLESARRIYSQGMNGKLSGLGEDGSGGTAAADATKRELLQAIDVRLTAVQQDLMTACSHAFAAGFDMDTVLELKLFANQFGTSQLNEACSKFISLCERRWEIINQWKVGADDRVVRSSCGSDMSIDDDLVSQNTQAIRSHSTCQDSDPIPMQHLRQPEEKRKDDNALPTESTHTSQPMRRLSVQERINMFESKQKENVVKKPVVVVKSDSRRLSTDVVSPAQPRVEKKAVLRRWSGVSDMSIDLSGEREIGESPLCTPSSASVSQSKSEGYGQSGSTDMAASSSNKEQHSKLSNINTKFSSYVESDGLKHHLTGDNCSKEAMKPGLFSTLPLDKTSKDENSSSREQFGSYARENSSIIGLSGDKNCSALINKCQKERTQLDDSSSLHLPSMANQRTIEVSGLSESGSITRDKTETMLAPCNEGIEHGVFSRTQPLCKSSGEFEKVGGSSSTFGDTEYPMMKFKKQADVTKQATSVFRSEETAFSAKHGKEAQEGYGSISELPKELAQKLHQSKGNHQELNDELKLKANELEKLFAEHKQRVPVDHQLNFYRRNRAAEIQNQSHSSRNTVIDNASIIFPDKSMLDEPARSSSDLGRSEISPVMKISDKHPHMDGLNENFSEHSFSESSRGKFYERYTQVRDAKLRQEWNLKGAEKEARLNAMQKIFEKSRVEMRAKFSGSAYKDDSVSSIRRRTERLRSFNSRALMQREKQSESEGVKKYPDAKQYVEESYFNARHDFSFEDACRSAQAKKLLPSKSSSSLSSPRISAATVPARSSVKTTNSNLGRRKSNSENPLAQSVPNFSPDMRKENAKPSSTSTKATRLHSRSSSHGRSTREEVFIKEDKSRRSKPLRKNSANVGDCKEADFLNSEDVVLTPLKDHKDRVNNKYTKKLDSKPFHKKSKSTDISSRVNFSMQKDSIAPETFNSDEEEYEDAIFEPEDPIINAVRHEGGDEELENVGLRQSCHESEVSTDFGSENGDLVRSFAHIDPYMVAELATIAPSKLNSTEHVENSPGESPVSWNSHSYPHELPDIDGSVDCSSVGSPTSWKSQSLSQPEVDDASRTRRKKWGSAQKPILAVSSSQSQSCKDVTRGFKRLLKFGRKPRGMESLVDKFSATTSEGDDDTEDGRDPSNHSCDDLRKSRMGFSRGHPSDDNFIEHECLGGEGQSLQSAIPAPPANFKLTDDHLSGSSLKAPKSFFSLPTFRSNKGSDSKIR